jgi:hypothetical protein
VTHVEAHNGHALPSSPCILWEGSKNPKGYGVIFDQEAYYTKNKRNGTLAHRFYHEQKHGKIPKGLFIDHLCRNRACINTEHMELVSTAVNVQRGKKTRLTIEQVIEIRTKYTSGKFTQSKLAHDYHVAEMTINAIVRKQTWKNI